MFHSRDRKSFPAWAREEPSTARTSCNIIMQDASNRIVNDTGVNDTSDKLFSGINDTGEKFICLFHGFSVIAGVVDTGEQFIAGDNDTGEQLSPVTTTPVINLLPVTRTRTPWRRRAGKDKRKLKGINRRYLRSPKSATAADGVIGTAMKSCIQKHPTHLCQRPLRPPKLHNAILV